MTDLRARLRDALSEREEERLSVDEVDSMRRVIVAAARIADESPRRREWLQPLALAATVIGMIAAGIAAGQRFEPRPATGAAAGADDDPADAAPAGGRQLHFSTPGGTRIIWIFNSDLDLKTTP